MKWWSISGCLLVAMQAFSQVEIGTTISDEDLKNGQPVTLLLGPANCKSGYKITLDSFTYSIVLDTAKRVEFFSISDPDFTLFQLTAGNRYDQIDRSLVLHEEMIPGFGYVVTLTDNWKVCFVDSEIINHRQISNSSTIGSFYKERD